MIPENLRDLAAGIRERWRDVVAPPWKDLPHGDFVQGDSYMLLGNARSERRAEAIVAARNAAEAEASALEEAASEIERLREALAFIEERARIAEEPSEHTVSYDWRHRVRREANQVIEAIAKQALGEPS